MELGSTAATWMRDQLADDDPGASSLLGMLRLRTAVAAARRNDCETTRELIARARRAADRLGHDGDYWRTGFGPTNVDLHYFSTLLAPGDAEYVAEHGAELNSTSLSIERRVSHTIDVARALSLVARDDDAAPLLHDAGRLAPHLVCHSPAVREIVKSMYRRAAVTGQSSSTPLGALAERCRAIQ